jgi:L-fuculose-phosphate aldolase
VIDPTIAGTVSGPPPQDPPAAVALGCRVLGAQDQSDLVWGHLSMRDPDGRGVWMKSSGWGFEEMTTERIVLVDDDGNTLAGGERRHAEYPIHTEIMAARPDVNCVVHTHSPSAVAFGATGEELRPVSHEANFFVPPAIPRFTDTTDLILTRELGAALAVTVGPAHGALMINHGIVVAAADIPTAVVGTVLLDRACRTQLAAMAAGGIRHWSTEQESRAKRQHCYPDKLIQQAWDYLVRSLLEAGRAGT